MSARAGLPMMPKKLSQLPEVRVATATPVRDGRQTIVTIHAPEGCNEQCAWHNPSDHPLKDAPWFIEATMFGPLVMRVCEHQIAHADVDSLAYVVNRMPVSVQDDPVSHGDCCGCCPYQEEA